MKLGGFFGDNQRLFYLQEQFGKEEYYDGLVSALKKAAKRYYTILKAIEFHHGYLEINQLPSFTISPVSNLIGHKNVSNIIEGLIKLNLILEDNGKYRLSIYVSSNKNDNVRYHQGVELAKEIVLSQFYNWSRNIGLVSFEKGTFHSEYSKFQWGFVAPSYVSGFIRRYENNNIKPAFVLADVLIGNAVNLEEVYFFIAKTEAIKSLNISNFLPFLIVQNVSQEALLALKSNGIIVAFIDKMFGSEYEELLKSLITTVTNAGAVLKDNPEQYIKLIEQLNKLVDGKTNNLRGDLFELAVGYYHSNICQSLDIGKKVVFDGKQREIDVLAVSQNEVRIAECKGYKYSIDLLQVEKWTNEKIPVIYDWTKSGGYYQNKKIVFEFWATGGFTDEAMDFLKSKKESVKKYGIEFFGEQEIMEKAKASNAQKIIDILREYFIKNV